MAPLISIPEIQTLLGVGGKPASRDTALRWALGRFKPVRLRPYGFRRSEILKELGVTA